MKEDKFTPLLKGKKVAIVGPAKYMMGKGWGEEIEKHDVVVRINRGIESTKKFPEDLGTRTDILYSCLIETHRNAGKLNADELADVYKIKHIVAPPHSDYKGISGGNTLHTLVNKTTVKRIKKRLPLRIISSKFHTKFAKDIKCKPNTGILAVYDLLNFDIKQLTVYGFSFYLDGFVDGQKSGVEKEKKVSEDGFANMAFTSKRHIQKNIWNHAKKTLPKNSKVKLDEVLKYILQMDKLDKKQFKEHFK